MTKAWFKLLFIQKGNCVFIQVYLVFMWNLFPSKLHSFTCLNLVWLQGEISNFVTVILKLKAFALFFL